MIITTSILHSVSDEYYVLRSLPIGKSYLMLGELLLMPTTSAWHRKSIWQRMKM